MLDITTPETNLETRPRIVVVGVGGAGGNAVENMISQNLEGCEFLVANTDTQALKHSSCDKHIQLGIESTKGLGAGANPEIGRKAAEESIEEISDFIDSANMVFIACGMGGGTGTGAASVIARVAREKGILTVGVVSKPFEFEGARRMKQAEAGVIELQKFVDTLIIIPNQNLFYQASQSTSLIDAFKMVDDVLHRGVSGVTDLMIKPGLINLDFNDISTVMKEMGKAVMGTGEASGEDRAFVAAENAINNKLLDDDNMKGAKAALINITASRDVSLTDVTDAVNRIRQELDEDANIIFGTTIDETIGETFRVSIVATGIDVNAQVNDTIDLDINRPHPDILFGERTETSDTFLDALQGKEAPTDTANTESSPDATIDLSTQAENTIGEDTIDIDILSSAQPSPQYDNKNPIDFVAEKTLDTKVPSHITAPTQPTENTINTASMDAFFEADLANASTSKESADTTKESISPEETEKGGFFKRLFGGIKKTESAIGRAEPVMESSISKTPSKPITSNPSTYSPSSDGSLALDSEQKTDEDMDIPSFLRKQMN